MGKTRVILTVDTEPSVAGAMSDRSRYSPLLDEPVWGEVNGRSEALGFITRTLDKYRLKATFFVETVHTRYFGADRMKRYTDHLLESEQDIQLHIHPVWQNFDLPESARQRYFDDCSELCLDELAELIGEGCEQIEAWTGVRPVAMRTGNFSSSRSVYQAMKKAKLALASNICIASASYSDKSIAHSGGIHEIESVHELPASCFVDPGPIGRGRYRAAQVTACSSIEIINLLKQCTRGSIRTMVLVTHPFEFLKKADFRYTSLRPNVLVQKRLEEICRFLSENPADFEVSTFSGIASESPLITEPAPDLQSSITSSIIRSAQNFINDRI